MSIRAMLALASLSVLTACQSTPPVASATAPAAAENGKIYVGTRAIGRVYELSDNGATRTSRVVVDKLVQPAGVAYAKGSLYVMAIDKVLRYDGIATNPSIQPIDMAAAAAWR